MRKLFGYIVLIVCVVIYIVSSADKLTNSINIYKTNPNSVITSDKFTHGDLYGIAFLSNFSKPSKTLSLRPPVKSETLNIDLYEICDSYIWAFLNSGKFYRGVNSLKIFRTNNQQRLNADLDRSKINVLVVEFAERNILPILKDSAYINHVIQTPAAKSSASSAQAAPSFKKLIRGLGKDASEAIFNKNININIESNIWELSVFTPVKEFKADLNYKLFKKVNKGVDISPDGEQLFYSKTIDTTKNASSFKNLSNKDIDALVATLNRIYMQGKKMGFKKVYLSLVPNPVSILYPRFNTLAYNNLVERIQNSPKLQMPCIDVLPEFREKKNDVFFVSDSHWNENGAQIWLDKFNAELIKIDEESKQR
jgi:hypothetical protein